jgi:hypothetical protein
MPKPKLKSSFRVFGYGKARFGWFDAARDEPALFAVQRVDGAAVVITTAETTYVFAPGDVAGLAAAIAERIPLSGLARAPNPV